MSPPTTTRCVFEDALPSSRQRLYLGHSARNTIELYTGRDLSVWLDGDAERMLAQVAGELSIVGASAPDFHPDTLVRKE